MTAGEARCFPSSHVTSLLTPGVSDPAWGGDRELWEGGNTQAMVERGHKDMSSAPMSPITPLSALDPSVPPLLSAPGGQCWQVNPAASITHPCHAISSYILYPALFSVCFNLPRNVIFSPGNLPMSR